MVTHHVHFLHHLLLFIDCTNLVVNIAEILVEILIFIDLVLVLQIRTHFSVPGFSDYLSLLNVTFLSNFGRLLNNITHQHVGVSFLFKLFTVIGHQLVLSDNSHTLVAIQGCVRDLSLEGELFDLGHININHLDELHNSFDCILECEN